MIAKQNYVDLITSEHYNKEKFISYVDALLTPLQSIVDALYQFDVLFKLDDAVGDQLDKLGEIMSLTRNLPVVDEDIVLPLSDASFRLVIKSKILQCFWNGSFEGYKSLVKAIFPESAIEVIDYQDMTLTTYVTDPTASLEIFALLRNGFLLPKPSGVRVNYLLSDSKLFGWDTDTSISAGWDIGKWTTT